MLSFRILKKSKRSHARLGVLKTPHGTVQTPAFVVVATQGVVKALTPEQVRETKTQLAICNTFHLHLKPGEKFVAKHGDLHNFSKLPVPLMTDSGGFQVFSLGFGRDLGVGKIAKGKGEQVQLGRQPQKVKITDRGVWFQSPIDGKKLFLLFYNSY